MEISSPIEIDGLTDLSVSVTGAWMRRDSYVLWEGFLEAESPFVVLIVGYVPLCTWWSKSNPSDGNRLELVANLLGWSEADGSCRVYFRAGDGGGGWIHQSMAVLPVADSPPEIDLPEKMVAGELVRFLEPPGFLGPILGLACFAKSDVVVRRKHVWGLKAPLLADASPELAQVLARGRHGCIDGVWPPNVRLPQLDSQSLERAEGDYFRYWCNLP